MDQKPLTQLINLSFRTAIVTGGARGIGYGIAYRLAEAGANVVVADLKQEEADEAAGKLTARGFKAKGIVTDVSNEESVKNLVRQTSEVFGSVDILVNNAGIYPPTPLSQMSLEQFKKVLSVNLEGVFLCTKYVSGQMIAQQRGGRIINITSIDALHPSMVGLAHYDASKHGVWGFTKNAALELAPHKIWVNAIAPGGIATPGVAQMQSASTSEANQKAATEAFLNKIPMRRMGEADEIGRAVLFLASELSSYMTGAQIVVDGGALLS